MHINMLLKMHNSINKCKNFYIKCSSLLFSTTKYKMITIQLAIKELNSRDLQISTAVNSPLYKSPLRKSQVNVVTDYIKIWANKCIINAKESIASSAHSSVLFGLDAKLTVHFLVHLVFH